MEVSWDAHKEIEVSDRFLSFNLRKLDFRDTAHIAANIFLAALLGGPMLESQIIAARKWKRIYLVYLPTIIVLRILNLLGGL